MNIPQNKSHSSPQNKPQEIQENRIHTMHFFLPQCYKTRSQEQENIWKENKRGSEDGGEVEGPEFFLSLKHSCIEIRSLGTHRK